MLSYRHGYHAGNFSDVLKHLVLIAILQYLKKKDAPFYYHDTHAGAGVYKITHPYMQKKREYEGGIGRLWRTRSRSALINDYLAIVRQVNPDGNLAVYPGSPEIASRLLRRTDRAWFGERHSTDFEFLSEHFHNHRGTHCEKMDSWEGLKAKLPPPERRGLIFIDPAYEIDSEYKHVYTGVAEGLRRFATGTYAIWYPVVDVKKTDKLIRRFAESDIANILHLRLGLTGSDVGPGMHASGMIILNPPYTLAGTMQETLPELVKLLGDEKRSGQYLIEKLGIRN
jgi:23S rRNA (adenine2030-N6)-methyltransferase